MSIALHILRAKKLVDLYASGPELDDRSRLLRSALFSFSTIEVTLQDRQYLDSRWQFICSLLDCVSAAELALRLDISRDAASMLPIDYVAVALGYCLEYCNEDSENVIIDMIDDYSYFDDAVKNTKFLRIILKCAMQRSIQLIGRSILPRKMLSHIAKKFPSILNMNLMFSRNKKGLLTRKISDDLLAKWH